MLFADFLGGVGLGALAGAVAGGVAVYRVMDPLLDAARAQLADALVHERRAADRLVAAWKDGYRVPEPEPEAPRTPFVEDPLPPQLAEWLAQWEDPSAREKWEAELRRRLAAGRSVDAILMDLEVGR